MILFAQEMPDTTQLPVMEDDGFSSGDVYESYVAHIECDEDLEESLAA